MTLPLAFVRLQPFGEDEDANREVDEAAGVILNTLRLVGRSLRFTDRQLVEDAAQVVLYRLIATGPRTDETGVPLRDAPMTDAAVRAFLYVSLRRACLSMLPSKTEEPVDPEHLESQPGHLMDFDTALVDYAAAEARVQRFFALLTPMLAKAAVELREIAGGRLTVDEIVEKEAGARPGDRKKARDRRYKRYERVLSELHALVDNDSSLSSDDKRLHHRVVDDLRVREKVGRAV